MMKKKEYRGLLLQNLFVTKFDTDFLRIIANDRTIFYNNNRDMSSVNEEYIKNIFHFEKGERFLFGWMDDDSQIIEEPDGIIFTTYGIRYRYIIDTLVLWTKIQNIKLENRMLEIYTSTGFIIFPLELLKSSSDEDADTFYTQMKALVLDLTQFAKKQVQP